jgi:hypothetical protein
MTIVDETTRTNRKATIYNTYGEHNDVEEFYGGLRERDNLLQTSMRKINSTFFQAAISGIIPSDFEDEDDDSPTQQNYNGNGGHESMYSERHHRSFRRRLFLFLTEPSSSWGSAIYFFILILAIFASNLIIILQTMAYFQYTPANCGFCRGESSYNKTNDDDQAQIYNGSDIIECVCPPRPYPYLERAMDYILIFFAVEWTLRVLSFVPAHPRTDIVGKCNDWFTFLTSMPTIFDALAIWPYFIEILNLPGLISLRLLRLFRVFQLVRLGKYNSMFVSLTNVLYKSLPFLRLMIVVLFFGASIFGSLVFW